MAVVEKSSGPTGASIGKDIKSLNTDSEHTMPLEEDEKMLEEDLSKPTEQLSCIPAKATRVKFAPSMTSYYLIMSRDEYTQDEIEEAFWTHKQYKRLNKSRKRTVERMEDGLEEKRSTPYRGLEKYTTWGYQQYVKVTKAYVNTVMDEMERQWMENKNELFDWEKISSLTEEMTKQSAQEAIQIALSDEKDANEFYMMSASFGKKRIGLQSHRSGGRRTSKVRKPKSRL